MRAKQEGSSSYRTNKYRTTFQGVLSFHKVGALKVGVQSHDSDICKLFGKQKIFLHKHQGQSDD